MGLRRMLNRVLHGDQRAVPRTEDAFQALKRKRDVERRLQKLDSQFEEWGTVMREVDRVQKLAKGKGR